MAGHKKRRGDTKEVPLERLIPDDLHLEFADSVIVQHSENEFYITFLQVEHPLAITNAEIASIKKVTNKAVARVVITPKHMALLIEALRRNFKKYSEKHGEIEVDES